MYRDLMTKLESDDKEGVVVARADAPELVGKVTKVEANGYWISFPHPTQRDAVLQTFVADRDIRGVSVTDWNYDLIS